MSTTATLIDHQILERAVDQNGANLAELSHAKPRLVVFLRHGGCTFCRQALADLARDRVKIEQSGTGIVLVHMETDAAAAALFATYNLADVPRISDPERQIYEAFELHRGSLAQVAGPAVWWKGFVSLLTGSLPGRPTSDVFQLPGTFLVQDGKIMKAFRNENSADRPDYCDVAKLA
jgi:hypothetical protein